MRIVELNNTSTPILGIVGENNVTTIRINVTRDVSEYPEGSPVIIYKRPNKTLYPIACSRNDNWVEFVLTETDLRYPGVALIELQWIEGESVRKHRKFIGSIKPSIGQIEDLTEDQIAWFGEMTAKLGDLSQLKTEDKISIVAAINELFDNTQTIQEEISDLDDIREKANSALQSFTETDPTVPSWAKQDEPPTYTAEDVGALPINTKISDLENDADYISVETDPTVPAWAKASSKPTYTAEEVGALPSDTSIPSKTSDLTNDSEFITADDIPVSSVNGETGAVTIDAEKIEYDPDVEHVEGSVGDELSKQQSSIANKMGLMEATVIGGVLTLAIVDNGGE